MAIPRTRILVVDDDPSMLRIVRRVLEATYEILEAHGAESAIALASRAAPVDLLLTDVVLERGHCEPMVKQLREAWPGLRVLYMSGYGADVVRRFGIGDDAHILSKPFTPDVLRQRLADLLREGPLAGIDGGTSERAEGNLLSDLSVPLARLARERTAAHLAESEVLPVCLSCQEVKTGADSWEDVATSLQTSSDSLSHGYCARCEAKLALEIEQGD